MTPQSSFMVVAPVPTDRMRELEELLESMTDAPGAPGMAKPDNAIVPFGQFDTLHYARFVILKDETLGDFEKLKLKVPHYDVTLAFLGDCDGSGDECLKDIAQRAGPGLRRIFSCCSDFSDKHDLLEWMRQHSVRPAAAYVNVVGRTVTQVHQEDALYTALVEYLKKNSPSAGNPQETRNALIDFVHKNNLNPPLHQPTPFGWWVRNVIHLLVPFVVLLIAAVLLYAFPVLRIPTIVAIVVLLIVFLWMLRHHEKTEPEIICRPTCEHDAKLAKLENHDVTNQFSVIGSVKPSLFRRWLMIIILCVIGYFARHVFTQGHLGRVRSIHFARWVFLNDKWRVMFASNYDGSLEAYNDDFINKVGFGLNLAFGSGVGYPRTNWLIFGGAAEEQKFKYTLRRHQIPTQVWYKAYPGLTAYDLGRNTRVRKGIERRTMSDAEIRAWLSDL